MLPNIATAFMKEYEDLNGRRRGVNQFRQTDLPVAGNSQPFPCGGHTSEYPNDPAWRRIAAAPAYPPAKRVRRRILLFMAGRLAYASAKFF
jgi:hypothetical protein